MKALEYLLSRPLMVTPEAYEAALAVVLREAETPTALTARAGRKVDGTEGVERRGSVALIEVVGPIYRYADMMTALCGGVTTAALARDVTAAADDPTVAAVVLSFDSPGGEVTGSVELAGLIRDAAGRKPVVAYAAGQCCSLAFLLASACSEVVCDAMAELGSVGVRGSYAVPTADPKRPRVEVVSSQSPNKVPDLTTEKGRAQVQRLVDDMAEVMIATIAANFGISAEAVVADFGGGGTLIGRKAVEAGMADRLGSLEGLIAELNSGARPSGPARTSAVSPAPTNDEKEGDMNWSPKALRAWLAKGQPLDFDPAAADAEPAVPAAPPAQASAPTPAPVTPAVNPADSPEFRAMRAEIDRLQAERVEALAAAFVQGEFHAGRILPAEATALKGAFAQALRDDASAPLAAGSRAQALRETYAARPKHGLYREQVSGQALPNDVLLLGQRANDTNPDAPPSAEAVDALLARFPAGKKLLLDRKRA